MPTALELTREGWQPYLDSSLRIQRGDGVEEVDTLKHLDLLLRFA